MFERLNAHAIHISHFLGLDIIGSTVSPGASARKV